MKQTLIKLLEKTLKRLSIRIIKKYDPTIIGITGSYGKSSCKEAIYAVVSKFKKSRTAYGNFNNELGFPLAIIGDFKQVSGKLFWIKAVLTGIRAVLFRVDYPEILVLEYAADRPGDLDYLIEIAKPHISVISGISKYPVHVEYYPSPKDVVTEKSKLIKCLSEKDFAVINADDEFTKLLGKDTKAKSVFFGFNKLSDVLINDFENNVEKGAPKGISFKLVSDNKILPIKLSGVLGKAQSYAFASAIAVAEILELDLFAAKEALQGFKSLPGRANIIKGVRGSWLIDDTYNASPAAMFGAIEALAETKSDRKIAVLGHMAELGNLTAEVHREVGKAVAGNKIDLLFLIGEKSYKIAEGAIAEGMEENRIKKFSNLIEAQKYIPSIAGPNDLILIKGSQSARMEKITYSLMAEPELAKDLLVRQYGRWITN